MPLSDNARGAVFMTVSMAAFTLNDAAMKTATQTLPLFQAIALRGVLAVLGVLALGVVLRGLSLNIPRRDMGVIALRSAAEVGGTVLFLAALMHMPLANLSAMLQALPLAVTLVAAVVFRERIGWRRMVAICVGFLGVLIIIRPGPSGFDIWSIMGLGSVACVVVRDLAARSLSHAVPSIMVALCAGASVTVMGFAGTIVQGWQAVDAHEALLIFCAAAMLTAGYTMSVMTMRIGDIGFVAPFRYSSLIWAIFLGWAAFGALPDGWTLFGAALVVATGIFTLWRERVQRKIANR